MRGRTVYWESRVDLTPMLDVVFILLIFFVVTATFVKEVGIDVNPPEPAINPPGITQSQNIVIGVSSRDRISVAGADVDRRMLAPLLRRLHAENPEVRVVLRMHEQSSNGMMVYVMDQARLAGVGAVSLASG